MPEPAEVHQLPKPHWEVVLAVLFGPPAIYYGVGWILQGPMHVSRATILDIYPLILSGVYLFLFLVVWQVSIRDGSGLSEIINLGRDKILPGIGLGVLLFFAILFISGTYSSVWASFIPVPHVTYSSNPLTIDEMIILLPLGAGVVEELVWRGYGITRLQVLTGSPWKSILISALAFGAWHLNLYQFGYTFLGGIFVGYVYYRFKSLVPCMLGHWLYDFVGAVFYFG